ncbi:hypothetical protein JQK15_20425 [Sphingobium sp. BHU LFT2]|uniref:hypothetical protein n=1 Tax=Sphingobium sp. BHU LFT2 TaxID=2807634 RepID=UPI001BE738C3|nr:hypothetical protein [Sphingobium sp. BHU LFT2]MBT2245881.1 hypothetical protein [Sphingobium sp. BHU LFT2]
MKLTRTPITMHAAAIVALATTGSFLTPVPAVAQGVDYHKAQQAGEVWQRKQAENNRRAVERQGSDAYHAPLARGERLVALVKYRDRYNRMVSSVGQKNADSWLGGMARADRAKR